MIRSERNLREPAGLMRPMRGSRVIAGILRVCLVFVAMSALVGLLGVAPVAADSRGRSAGLVLSYPVGARALAMGSAYTASVGDLSGMHQNPAALGFLDTWGVSAFYQRRIAGDNFGGIAFNSGAGPGVVGVSLLYYSAGDAELTGSGTSSETRTVEALKDYVLGVSYAAGPVKDLELGMTLKVLRSTLVEEFTASSVSLDLGLQYRAAGGKLHVGAAVRHLGTGLMYDDWEDHIPRTFGAGVVYIAEVAGGPLTLAGDLVKVQDLDPRGHAGFEYVIERVLAVRLGYRFGYDTSDFTFGLGATLGGFEIGYSVGVMEEFDDVHMTQLTYRF